MPTTSELTPREIVRRARLDKNLSREQLAVAAGISSATLGRLERDGVIPKHSILASICRELGIPVVEIYEAIERVA